MREIPKCYLDSRYMRRLGMKAGFFRQITFHGAEAVVNDFRSDGRVVDGSSWSALRTAERVTCYPATLDAR